MRIICSSHFWKLQFNSYWLVMTCWARVLVLLFLGVYLQCDMGMHQQVCRQCLTFLLVDCHSVRVFLFSHTCSFSWKSIMPSKTSNKNMSDC